MTKREFLKYNQEMYDNLNKRINPGDIDSYYVRANSLAITDENDNITGGDYITVHDLYNTSFSNILQISNATVCGKRLGSINSNAVYVANNRIYNVDFPVDLNNPDIPNLSDSYRSRAAALSSWASQQGINLNKQAERAQYVDTINKKASAIGLSDQLLNPDGSYKENWRNFGVMEVIFEEGAVDLSKQEGNKTMNNDAVKALLDDGASWSTMWLKFGQQTYPYDDNFRAVSNFAINNKIKQGK